MENLEFKELLKKAKKEEKKNPEFLYYIGIRFKNGVGIPQSDSKAAKYFDKAASLGHIQSQIEMGLHWWKLWKSYYYANLYFSKAIDQGSEEAKKLLLEMQHTLEDKDNPEFLYKQGLSFLNGDGVALNINKGIDLLYKSGKLNYDNAKLEYSKYYANRFYVNQAEIWLTELIEKGNEEAKVLLENLQKLKDNKTLIAVANGDFYETPKFKDDEYTSFLKRHTLICCPACRGKLKEINYKTDGQLTEKMVTVFDKGTSFEHTTDAYDHPTYAGQTVTLTYECECCKLSFDKVIHTKLEIRDKQDTLKEMITGTGGKTEWWKLVKISYETDKTKVGKDVLKILKNGEGKFEGK